MEESINKNNKKQKSTKAQFQKRTIKFLFFAYIVVIILWAIINHFSQSTKTIYEKIGSYELSSISIREALNIKGYAILPYADYIKAGDTKSAYEMLTEDYRKVVSYEEYLESIKGIDFNTFNMKEIKLKAEGTYVATVVYERNGEEKETDYLLYLNELNPKIITISPNKFIYNFGNLKFKMDGLELKLEECNIYTDSIKMTAIIKNTSLFDTMTFTNIGVGYGENINKSQNVEFALKPGEMKEIEIDYETDYYIPNNIKIKRKMNEETLRTYTFYFEKGK